MDSNDVGLPGCSPVSLWRGRDVRWSLDELRRLTTDCPCGKPHQPIPIEHLRVGPGALAEAAAWIRDRFVGAWCSSWTIARARPRETRSRRL